jgi:hypothetical protein
MGRLFFYGSPFAVFSVMQGKRTVKYISVYSEKLRRSAGLNVRQTSGLSVRTPRSGLLKRVKNLFDIPVSAAADFVIN